MIGEVIESSLGAQLRKYSALKSSGGKLAGIIKTLSER
jgi:hypothetical protein